MRNLKRMAALLLALSLCLGLAISASAATLKATDFSDFDADAWYAEAVSSAVDDGLLIGNSNGKLNPMGKLTRAEMATVLNRAFGAYGKGDVAHFTDLSTDVWYYPQIQMAYHMETYVGCGDNIMAPLRPITRQEVMAALCRALQLSTSAYADTDLSAYEDADEIDPWAVPIVKAMVACGYVRGDGKNLNPDAHITRAEFAQMMANIIDEYITESGIYTGDREGNLLIRAEDITLHDMNVEGDLILGCGVADGKVTLSNVTVIGRVVVWGGGTEAVYMNDGTDVTALVVCRVDDAVKVIFDRDSTLAVYKDIKVRITDWADAFEDTEVIFYDISDILDAQDKVNDFVDKNTIQITMPADLFATVDSDEVSACLTNGSDTDTYTVELRRVDNGDLLTDPLTLAPGETISAFKLTELLPYGNYPCTAIIYAERDGQPIGTVELSVTLHVAYLWEV